MAVSQRAAGVRPLGEVAVVQESKRLKGRHLAMIDEPQMRRRQDQNNWASQREAPKMQLQP